MLLGPTCDSWSDPRKLRDVSAFHGGTLVDTFASMGPVSYISVSNIRVGA